MVYRAVKANNSDDIIAIGADENQGGVAYHDLGVWCDFTFTEIPELDQDVKNLMEASTVAEDGAEHERDLGINLLKVDGSTIRSKTLAEVEAELGA